jgi:hypothetical protein
MRTDVQAAQTELTAMGNSTNISFTFNTVSSNAPFITHGKTSGGDLQITVNNTGSFESRAHELKHGYQVLNGQMTPGTKGPESFSWGSNSIQAGYTLETEAYRRQYAVGGTMPPSNVGTLEKPVDAVINSIFDINNSWVPGIYTNNNPSDIKNYLYLYRYGK